MVLTVRTFIIIAMIIASGCRSMRENLSRYDAMISEGRIAEAASFSSSLVKVGERTTPARDDLLWLLQTANAYRLAKQYKLSNEYFNRAEGLMKYYDLSNAKIAQSAAAVAVNDTLLPYYGSVYEGIMINTYKALNYMSLGDMESARVEFNRATERQRRAKEHFSSEIAKIRESIISKDQAAAQNINDSKINSILEANYPELKRFEPYPDFINPFTSYIAGLFFYLEGDYSKAEFLIRQSAGMVGEENKYVLEELNSLTAPSAVKDTLWVVFENGLSAVKEEIRVDLPLFVATNQIQYVGIALPKLRTRAQASPYIIVSDGVNRYNTVPLASMDRVIKTEFEKSYGAIFARAVASATTKAIAQYALYKEEGSVGSLLAAIYAYATTQADLRVWTSLPKEFQLLRIAKPESGRIRINGASNTVFSGIDIEIPGEGNSILYIRMIKPDVAPVWDIINF